jgi:putative ABC transport system permease protein
MPLYAEVSIDRPVLLFAVAMSFLAAVVFGVAPAFALSRSLSANERFESASRETLTLRGLLVAGEVALSVILVIGAVLLIRSLAEIYRVDPGFKADDAVAFTVTLPSARYPDAAARLRAATEIERRLTGLPGAVAVGATSTLALRGYTWTGDSTVEGRASTDYERETRHASTSAGYFASMGIRLLAGRPFSETDTRESPDVTIVNETLARRYFHGTPVQQVVGKRIAFGRPQDNSEWIQIVGVVSDEKQDGLDQPVQPTAYSSIAQHMQNPLTYVVRSTQDAAAVLLSARRAVSSVDRDLALTNVATLKEVVEASLEGQRFRTTLLTAFAAIALLLAGLGIYGVLAYSVSQRSRELGVRLALGAAPTALFRLIVAQGMRPVASGAIVGIVASAGVTRVMQSLLFNVRTLDLSAYAAGALALTLIAAAACALPAARASRVDPVIVLRDE